MVRARRPAASGVRVVGSGLFAPTLDIIAQETVEVALGVDRLRVTVAAPARLGSWISDLLIPKRSHISSDSFLPWCVGKLRWAV